MQRQKRNAKGGEGGRSLKLNENLDSGLKGSRQVSNMTEVQSASNFGTRLCGCVILQSLTTLMTDRETEVLFGRSHLIIFLDITSNNLLIIY